MINNNHPITPPDELVMEWINKHYGGRVHRDLGGVERTIATQAARWGYTQRGAINEAELQRARDEELEAVIAWMMKMGFWGGVGEAIPALRAARRPKPPSLKEQGREALHNILAAVTINSGGRELDVLKEIVESLPD